MGDRNSDIQATKAGTPDAPAVTILMAVYNGEDYLRLAIDSILSQTFKEFELLVIEDGSTDSSPRILASYDDTRIRVLHNERNIGLTASLNVGIREAHGEFIARMDADDICAPDRLEKQVHTMRAAQELVLLGSSYRLIDSDGNSIRTKIKAWDDFQVRWVALFRTPVEHSSAIIRRSVLLENKLFYDEQYRSAQDYDFWLRLLEYGRGSILRDILLDYRMHGKNITSSPSTNQMSNVHKIALDNITRRWPELSPFYDDINILLGMYLMSEQATVLSVRNAVRGMDALVDAFCRKYSASSTQRKWVRRQAAGILAEALLRRGRCHRNVNTILSLIRCTPRYVLPLLARIWEDKIKI